MIILAAAIILSLSNSGIISKANKAKTDSDTANLKEYVNTLRAEWELMTDAERTASGSITFEDYANKKLEANGYNVMLSDDGVLMNEAATAAVKAGIKVGDVVTKYKVSENTYETSGEENTAPSSTETDPTKQTVTANTKLTWKYLGVNANGELEIMADLGEEVAADNTKVKLSGKGGYLKGPEMLNTICEKLYSVSGVGTARSMNIDDVNSILGYTGPKGSYYDTNYNEITTAEPLTIGEIESKLGTTLSQRKTPDGKDIAMYYSDYYEIISKTSTDIKNTANTSLVCNTKNTYWLATPCVRATFGYGFASFDVRGVDSNGVGAYGLCNSDGRSRGKIAAVRPVVTLSSNVKLTPNADKTEWSIN